MILGRDREKVIDNIRRYSESGEFYNKVELDDPVLTAEQENQITDNYLKRRKTLPFKFKSAVARFAANRLTDMINKDTEIIGLSKVENLKGGAFVTSNHFSPVENTVIRHLTRELGKKRLNVVSQVSNLAMSGVIGFLMNYADIIPLSGSIHYMKRTFSRLLAEYVKNGEWVLIYPEQEMWFNYRKPRPPKRGAYYYAAETGAPVVSCFVEITDLNQKDTEEFYKVRYTLHILEVLYPDPEKSVKENSILLSKRDYELKKQAYEKAYGKPLDYKFEPPDIAGWCCKNEKSEKNQVL